MSRDVAIGTYLAALREKAGLKQNEVARRLGCGFRRRRPPIPI
jgi:transcriptional regulator with XRE-family HTH domain